MRQHAALVSMPPPEIRHQDRGPQLFRDPFMNLQISRRFGNLQVSQRDQPIQHILDTGSREDPGLPESFQAAPHERPGPDLTPDVDDDAIDLLGSWGGHDGARLTEYQNSLRNVNFFIDWREMFMVSFGAMKVKAMLAATSYPQLAAAIGVDRTYTWMIFNGVRRPSLDVACRLARHLGVSVEELVAYLDSVAPGAVAAQVRPLHGATA
jgi:DNA-binding XRE family transcriptional regulator